jgi:hypothetical protein
LPLRVLRRAHSLPSSLSLPLLRSPSPMGSESRLAHAFRIFSCVTAAHTSRSSSIASCSVSSQVQLRLLACP